MSMTPEQILGELKALATAVAPALPPGAALAVTLAMNALQALQNARNAGHDVTPTQLDALFAADTVAKQDDLLAQQEAIARKAQP